MIPQQARMWWLTMCSQHRAPRQFYWLFYVVVVVVLVLGIPVGFSESVLLHDRPWKAGWLSLCCAHPKYSVFPARFVQIVGATHFGWLTDLGISVATQHVFLKPQREAGAADRGQRGGMPRLAWGHRLFVWHCLFLSQRLSKVTLRYSDRLRANNWSCHQCRSWPRGAFGTERHHQKPRVRHVMFAYTSRLLNVIMPVGNWHSVGCVQKHTGNTLGPEVS